MYANRRSETTQRKYSHCSTMFVPQQFEKSTQPKKKQFRKHLIPQYPSGKKKYSLRKSKAKCHFLNKEKHVRKYSKNKIYSGNLTCFASKKSGHLQQTVHSKNNLMRDNKNVILVETTQEDLLEVTADISDNESVYSIISEDLSSLILEPELSTDLTFLDTILSNG